ncbi:MAG: cytochrome d ubiquinol oxidase subunit II [Methylococcaceae bacterium]|nr:cytochrome d ubiquinol oxidase subunit II [Methylococcaceae bacterium]
MIDYETIRVIWWLFTGVVAIGFTVTEGFDFGIGALLPFLGKSDVERRVILNTIGPNWEGNQVWLILLGGALFAVWPPLYATLFSGLYVAMLLVLFSLFMRPTGFDFRSKVDDPTWRNAWDWALFAGGALPPILLGVLVGNLVQGLPYRLDQDLRTFYEGSFWALLNPFALLCGVVGLAGMAFHGAIYLGWRTEGVIHRRACAVLDLLGPVFLVGLTVAILWTIAAFGRPEITSMADTAAPSNPLNKTVTLNNSWLAHFAAHPWMWAAPVVGVAGMLTAWLTGRKGSSGLAFLSSSIGISGVLLTLGFALFPFLLISSIDPRSSYTIWDASASHFNLLLSFWITVVFLPIVLLYTRWAYKVMWGKVTERDILQDSHTLY